MSNLTDKRRWVSGWLAIPMRAIGNKTRDQQMNERASESRHYYNRPHPLHEHIKSEYINSNSRRLRWQGTLKCTKSEWVRRDERDREDPFCKSRRVARWVEDQFVNRFFSICDRFFVVWTRRESSMDFIYLSRHNVNMWTSNEISIRRTSLFLCQFYI